MGKITVESQRDVALRADEYAIVSLNRDGEEVEVLAFHVTDSGHFHLVCLPEPLVNEKRQTDA